MREKIVNTLNEIALYYEAENEGWKARAYRKAVSSIKSHTGSLPTTEAEWQELPNIGSGIAAKIVEIQLKGKSSKLKELQKNAPPASVQEFVKIPGVGIKKAKAIFLKYRATTLKSLYKLYDNEQIEEDWLNKGLKILRERGEVKRIPLYQALEILENPLEELASLSFVLSATPAGSIRRMNPSVKDFDVVLCVKDSITIENAVRRICKKYGLEDSGDRKCYIPCGKGRFIDLYLCHPKHFGTMLLYLTGSGEWGAWLRSIAKKKGWKLNQYCLTLKDDKKIYYTDEKPLLEKILGIYVPPECRERPGDLGKDVVSWHDVKGDFHTHTTKSDGKDKPTDMIKEAKQLGYKFLGFADHVGFMPWSVRPSDYRKWIKTFRANQDSLSIKGVLGAEIDISKTGKRSIDKSTAKLLDCVVMSAHQQPGKNLEERYIKTMEYFAGFKGIKILAHPINRNMSTGVMLEWGDINWLKIFKVAAETNTYVEINGTVERMDLDATLARLAKSVGCKFVLSSDAHSVSQMRPNMMIALAIARKAQLTPKDILNCTWK